MARADAVPVDSGCPLTAEPSLSSCPPWASASGPSFSGFTVGVTAFTGAGAAGPCPIADCSAATNTAVKSAGSSTAVGGGEGSAPVTGSRSAIGVVTGSAPWEREASG